MNFENCKRNFVTCKGALIRLSADFLAESLKARGELGDMSKVLKEKKLPNKNTIISCE